MSNWDEKQSKSAATKELRFQSCGEFQGGWMGIKGLESTECKKRWILERNAQGRKIDSLLHKLTICHSACKNKNKNNKNRSL
jgi:hypothetical protein